MSGLVGVIANDSARYSLFSSCIDRLTLPGGWRKEWLIGGDWCGARNSLCRLVLDDEHAEYLWFMDDDHAFPPSLLTRLLAHGEALVTPICLTRTHPFHPVAYTQKLEGEYQYLPIPLSEAASEGLVEIQAGGCAGMLIRRDVIEAIEPPWFEYTDRSEDIVFCEKAKAAGFKLHADLGCVLGHITTAVVWPQPTENGWETGLTIGRDLNITVETADVLVNRPWTWTLRYEDPDDVIVVQLERPPNEPTNWQPPLGRMPEGVLQWWVDENDGNGRHPVGDPFTYELKETTT